MEVFEMNMFVGTVQIVGVSPPAEEERIESEDLFEAEHNRY